MSVKADASTISHKKIVTTLFGLPPLLIYSLVYQIDLGLPEK